MSQAERTSAILLTVSRIPAGKVASYGQIAQIAGYPGAARQVGQILSRLSANSQIPWHRVINARGRISIKDSERQRQALLAEGIEISGDRIDLHRYRWHPGC